MDNQSNDNAEALRAAVSARAECGWGCFCDACWLGATQAEKRHLEERRDDALGAEFAVYDALWSLAFGDDGAHAQASQGAQSLLERAHRNDAP